ncbi:hypothetical protein D3C75_672780 [compost metagenome]
MLTAWQPGYAVHRLLYFAVSVTIGADRFRRNIVIQINFNIALRGILFGDKVDSRSGKGIFEIIPIVLGIMHIGFIIASRATRLGIPAGSLILNPAVAVIDVNRAGNSRSAVAVPRLFKLRRNIS